MNKNYQFFILLLLLASLLSLINRFHQETKFERVRKVGFFLMGTDRYLSLVENLLESMEKYFCINNQALVHYFIFTDNKTWSPTLNSDRQFKLIYRKHQSWTMNTLLRFGMILSEYERLDAHSFDYLYWLDAEMKMVDLVCEDIFGDRVATMHADYFTSQKSYPYESRNRNSTAFIDQKHRYEHPYYVGSFFGGNAKEMFNLMTTCHKNIQYDLEKLNFIARVHDESHLNR